MYVKDNDIMLEDLKKRPEGVCLGYSSITYLVQYYPTLCGTLLCNFVSKLRDDERLLPDKLYPRVSYIKDDSGTERLMCRLMFKIKDKLAPVGLVTKLDKQLNVKTVTIVTKQLTLPLDTDIDSLYEVKEQE